MSISMSEISGASFANAPSLQSQSQPSNPETALDRLTEAPKPFDIGLAQWSGMTSTEQARATALADNPIQLARVDVLPNGTVAIRPEDRLRSDAPDVTLPNNDVGAAGFSPGFWTHDYLVTNLAPPSLQGPAGLAAVERALVANPTPGQDNPSTAAGARNDVGRLTPFDGGDNFVRSYVIQSNDPRRSDAVVNYTQAGEHALAEGFVLRYAELRADGRVELVTYGEGNAGIQSNNTDFLWRGEVTRVWSGNAQEIFNQAQQPGRN